MNEARAKVLVVDDEESVRGVLCKTLVEAGDDVISAADGQEALDLISTGNVGVILLDVNMPGLSGFDVLAQVRAHSPDISVIIVTAIADLTTGVNAIRQGAYDYVTKPFDLDAISKVVRRAHEHRVIVRLDRDYQRRLDEKLRMQETRLREQFGQLVEGLAREHELVLTVETLGRSKFGRKGASALPPELQRHADSVERFVEALQAAIRSGSLVAR